jgi:flavodoxin
MARGLVIYYSKSGNTKAMANIIAESMENSGLPTKCKSVSDVKVDDLLNVDVIVVGSPTYYGRAAGAVPHSAVRPIPAAATKQLSAKLTICF